MKQVESLTYFIINDSRIYLYKYVSVYGHLYGKYETSIERPPCEFPTVVAKYRCNAFKLGDHYYSQVG